MKRHPAEKFIKKCPHACAVNRADGQAAQDRGVVRTASRLQRVQLVGIIAQAAHAFGIDSCKEDIREGELAWGAESQNKTSTSTQWR